METKDAMTAGIEKMNALIAWWGLPATNASGAVERHMQRWQTFAKDLQKAYVDAYSAEVTAAFDGNDRLGRSFQELLQCRQPQEFVAAESEIFALLLERASLRAKRWAELTEKLQDCCATMARDAAGDLRPPSSDGEQQVAKPARRQAATA